MVSLKQPAQVYKDTFAVHRFDLFELEINLAVFDEFASQAELSQFQILLSPENIEEGELVTEENGQHLHHAAV